MEVVAMLTIPHGSRKRATYDCTSYFAQDIV